MLLLGFSFLDSLIVILFQSICLPSSSFFTHLPLLAFSLPTFKADPRKLVPLALTTAQLSSNDAITGAIWSDNLEALPDLGRLGYSQGLLN